MANVNLLPAKGGRPGPDAPASPQPRAGGGWGGAGLPSMPVRQGGAATIQRQHFAPRPPASPPAPTPEQQKAADEKFLAETLAGMSQTAALGASVGNIFKPAAAPANPFMSIDKFSPKKPDTGDTSSTATSNTDSPEFLEKIGKALGIPTS